MNLLGWLTGAWRAGAWRAGAWDEAATAERREVLRLSSPLLMVLPLASRIED